MIYSRDDQDLRKLMEESGEANSKKFIQKPEDYWLRLMNETFFSPRVSLYAYPSSNLSLELQANETKRVRDRIREIGPAGLEAIGQVVNKAKQSQSPPSKEALTSVPFADVDSIDFMDFKVFNYTFTEGLPAGFDLRAIPIRMHLTDVPSKFVRIHVFFDGRRLPVEDRKYLVPFLNLILNSAIRSEDDRLQDLDEVIKRRNQYLVQFDCNMGFKGEAFFAAMMGRHDTFVGLPFTAVHINVEQQLKIRNDAAESHVIVSREGLCC